MIQNIYNIVVLQIYNNIKNSKMMFNSNNHKLKILSYYHKFSKKEINFKMNNKKIVK